MMTLTKEPTGSLNMATACLFGWSVLSILSIFLWKSVTYCVSPRCLQPPERNMFSQVTAHPLQEQSFNPLRYNYLNLYWYSAHKQSFNLCFSRC